MPFCFKATRYILKTCAAAATLGVALAPSSALAVTTWNWFFAAGPGQPFGSGTFTTADVTPAANTTYEITAISGTYNVSGSSYSITGLESYSPTNNTFRWNGSSSSPILLNSGFDSAIIFNISTSGQVLLSKGGTGAWAPLDGLFDPVYGEPYTVITSSLAPVIIPPAPSTAAPGPLPLLGAAAAFLASRRLRRRLSGSLPAA
jgi:hypothetical protein